MGLFPNWQHFPLSKMSIEDIAQADDLMDKSKYLDFTSEE